MPNPQYPFEYTIRVGHNEELEFKVCSRRPLPEEQQRAAVVNRLSPDAVKNLGEAKKGAANVVYVD